MWLWCPCVDVIGRTDPNASSNNPNLPLRRPGLATEAAGSMLILASPYSSYITGHTLEVTGGAGI
jgi:NAD(P)-dependent dehydrogenase (short-subunit alcohol dehydrogenase family)